MATVFKLVGQRTPNGAMVYSNTTPTALVNTDQSSPIDLGNTHLEKSWQVTGTFGVGGSIQLEASNDGVNWVIVGAAVTTAALTQASAIARYFRFNVTAGDGTTALVVTLVAVEVNL